MQAEYYASVYGLVWEHDGERWHLLFKGKDTGPAKGDTVTDFRGETARLDGGRPPHRPGTTGKVYVTLA
jgi:hypothetical protein